MSKAKTYGKQMPKSEARPLGTKKKVNGAAAARKAAADRRNAQESGTIGSSPYDLNVVDSAPADEVESEQVEAIPLTDQLAAQQQEHIMTLTLKTLSKNGKQAYYSGAAQVLRFPLAVFPDKIAPQTLVDFDEFVPAKAPKVRETKEERKARLAAQPKPTEAERIQKAEANLAKRKAKLAAADQL